MSERPETPPPGEPPLETPPGVDTRHGIELDLGRGERRGYPEAVYCEGKTPDQVGRVARLIAEAHDQDAAEPDEAEAGPHSRATLFTRAGPEHAAAIIAELPDAYLDERARLLAWPPTPPAPTGGLVVVAAAGTSDQPVALEAAHTARFLGRAVESVDDIGIAGVHRTLARVDLLRSAAAIVVVAGMDGALPGLIAGLVPAPVIAVPTSVGYGAAFEGIAALLTMLNACAPGVAVVNIDNGYGAGHMAAQIARHAPPPTV
ncbi:MAG: nickel pincer cofactor biosynthesis protein LarB [Dermatophilaceae bacterium]